MSGYFAHKRVVLALIGLGCASSAQALEQLSISDGVTTSVIADNGVGDINGLPGVITYLGSFPSWVVTVTTGVSKPFSGSAATPSLHLESVDVSSVAGGGALTIMLTDTDFGASPTLSGFTSELAGVLGLAPGTSLSYATYLDTSNTAFGMATPLSSIGPVGAGPFAASANAASGPLAGPYSLTLQAVLVHPTGVGVSSFTGKLDAKNSNNRVPDAGSSLLLFGSSLTALGFFARFRKPLNRA